MQQQEDIFKKFASAILDSLRNIPVWKNGILDGKMSIEYMWDQELQNEVDKYKSRIKVKSKEQIYAERNI